MSDSTTLSPGMSQGRDATAWTTKWVGRCVTSLIVIGPLVAILLVVIGLWGRQVGIADLALLVAGTVTGALTALVWGGLVRIFLVHHVTWSVNSVCHTFGRRPFLTRDRSKNFAPLALLSLGESWHNSHHAFPTLARHGVDRGQLDITAACIRIWERLGLVHDVRSPRPSQLWRRRATVGA